MRLEGRKQKILIVHNYYQIPGGEDTVVANEKKMLENHGHEVILYSRSNSEIKGMSWFQKLKLPITTVFNPRTYTNIKKLIREEKIDIVHVHNTLSLISPAVYYAAIRCKVPVVQTVHNFRLLCPGATFYRDGHICEECVEHGLQCAIKHGCYRGSRAQTLLCVVNTVFHRLTGVYKKINYICLTDFNKQKLLELRQIEPSQVFVKPNFTYEPTDKNVQGDFYFFAGRIEDIKGISVLLEAFKNMPTRNLKIAGNGTGMKKYQHQKTDNVDFVGFLRPKELQQLLRRAKAVIVTSQWYETFGMVVIEAFACGVPVIVGDIGNVGNLVDDEINGVKFKYDSFESLVCAVKKFETLDQDILRQNAYKKYKQYFSQEKNYEVMQTIYDEMIARGGKTCNKNVNVDAYVGNHWERRWVAA